MLQIDNNLSTSENLSRHMCKTLEWVIRLPLLITDTFDNIENMPEQKQKKNVEKKITELK